MPVLLDTKIRRLDKRRIAIQPVRLATPEIAIRITAFPPADCESYAAHLRRFIALTSLRAIQWINITPRLVRFVTIG
jgi:hypothetical protein